MTIDLHFGGWWNVDADIYLAAVPAGFVKAPLAEPVVASLGSYALGALAEYGSLDLAHGEIIIGRPQAFNGREIWIGLAGCLPVTRMTAPSMAVGLSGLWALRFMAPRRIVEIAMPDIKSASDLGEALIAENLDVAEFGLIVLSVREGRPTS